MPIFFFLFLSPLSLHASLICLPFSSLFQVEKSKAMKICVWVAFLVIVFLMVQEQLTLARHINQRHSHHGHHHMRQIEMRDGTVVKPNSYWAKRRPVMKRRGADTVQIAGSSLPDCSHACGSCSPCRLVMVSFVCSSLEEAETCPMAYKCMCNNKSYPVP